MTEGGKPMASNSSSKENRVLDRRAFLAGASALGASSLLSYPQIALAEPPPETMKLTLTENPITCLAPQYVAQELLYSEGFTDVRYLKFPSETKLWPPEGLVSGEIDIALTFNPTDVMHIDAGSPYRLRRARRKQSRQHNA
jgi:NitT/TauT family transport system substrate-binding protein